MKKLLVLFALLVTTATSQAAYLYWQVTETSMGDYSENASYASIYKDGVLVDSIYYGDYGNVGDKFGVPITSEVSINVADANDGSSYYIELYQYDNATSTSTKLARSEEKSWTELYGSGAITSSLTSIPQVWTAGGFGPAPIPEPTTGMLTLLGFALLSLKRRKA